MFRPPKPLRRTSKAPSTSASSNADFPYFQYLSVLGTLTLLLSFTSVILPASTSIFTTLPPQQSSLDKPQHRLLIPITASPIWTMIWLCMGTAVCQAWWAGWMRTWWANYPRLGFTRSGENEEDEEKRLLRRDPAKIPALRDACANTFSISLFFHLIIVALGAPITSFAPQTYLLALFISLLTVFAPSYTLSLPIMSLTFFRAKDPIEPRWLASIQLFGQRRMDTAMERAVVFPVIATLVGSWVGAFAIALDWDRPWQAWPLTPAYGALAGYLFGSWSSFAINVILYLARQDQESTSASIGRVISQKNQTNRKKL